MRAACLFAGSLVAVVAGATAQAAPCRLDGLTWMGGVWRSDGTTTQSEERWKVATGGRIMGSSWLLHADGPGGVLEASTIVADGAQVALRIRHFSADLGKAREDKDAPMLFLARACEGESVVFDGQGPQAGEHMTYRREGDRMDWIGDFLHDGKPVRAEATFIRASE